MKSVEGQGLGHRYDGITWLFSDLHISLLPGEVVGIVGPSGSGKSTLLSILAGWISPTVGDVKYSGINHIGWVFQNPHGVPQRTALDHIVLPFLARGSRRDESVAEALELMRLFRLAEVADHPFKVLSGGEAQRLMLARAIATGSDLVLVDEPTAQLDHATAETVNAVLANLAQKDMLVAIATHDPRTRDACTRVVNLSDYQAT